MALSKKIVASCILSWLLASVLGSVRGSASRFPILMVISFDGFRSDYVNDSATPNLHRLISEGVTVPWIEPRFITKTFPNHHSIATGLYEESHGIVANNFFDPVLNDTFNLSDSKDPKWWNTSAVPLWLSNQRADPERHSGGMLWPGTEVQIDGELPFRYWNYSTEYSWSSEIDAIINWITDPTEPVNCVFMYFNQPDKAAHNTGPFSEEVHLQISRLDNITGYLMDRLTAIGLYSRVNLIFTSDHGMSEVPNENLVVLSEFVDPALFRAFGNAPVFNILPNPGQENIVYEALFNASKTKNFTVYRKDEIPVEFHYKNNRRVMPIVVVADDHWDLSLRPTIARKSVHGSHGYDNSNADMRAYFVGHGPGFKKGFVGEPFLNLDIYPLACYLLGLTPRSNNGSLDRVLNLLSSPPLQDVDSIILIVVSVVLCLCLIGALFAVATLRHHIRRKSQSSRMGTSRQNLLSDSSSSLETDTVEEERGRLLPNYTSTLDTNASEDK